MPGQISWMTCSSLCTSPELGVRSFGPLKIDIPPANFPGSQNSYSLASYIQLREYKLIHNFVLSHTHCGVFTPS